LQPPGFKTRWVDAGLFASFSSGLLGRVTSSPPQLGQVFFSTPVTQAVQKVHSKVQIMASVESGGRSLSQHSQLGRICSIFSPGFVERLVLAERGPAVSRPFYCPYIEAIIVQDLKLRCYAV
jgi:hypothetical protein